MSAAGPSAQERSALREAATAWLEQDPDEETREQLRTLLTRAGLTRADEQEEPAGEPAHEPAPDQASREEAWQQLHDRFRTRLAFGTAGLRGELGAGPNRMNRVLVAQTARGFAEFLLEREASPTIVIGYDARNRSDAFARDTAEIMQAAGVRATLLPRQAPTPVLAYAVRHLGASAGVMVTASHNPKRDNGYKVYLGGEDGGSQIVSPADARIAEHIGRIAASMRVPQIPRDTGYAIADDSIEDAYIAQTAAAWRGEPTPLHIAYTPLHGVGWRTFRAVLDRIGIEHPVLVTSQAEPDGSFPTLDFPNPEEPGALDLAYEAAEAAGARIVLAHDPDADRLAVAIRRPEGWHRFGGNEIGKLLGWHIAERITATGAADAPAGAGAAPLPTLATSLVSSPALEAVARAHGLGYAETPTGFKWISRAEGIAYGYEEALGYLVDPGKVRDKDGISAAIVMLEILMRLEREGRTLDDQEAAFADRFGVFASRQLSTRFTDATRIPGIMAALRAEPPQEIGGSRVVAFDDFREGIGAIPPSDILRIRLDDGTRIMVRPSGTEPKIKCYIDAQSSEGDRAGRENAANLAAERAESGMRELFAAL